MARQSMTPRQAEWNRFEDGWTATNPVPGWVHMADCPPTDEEPWQATLDELDEDRGLWLGAVLLALAFLAGLALGLAFR